MFAAGLWDVLLLPGELFPDRHEVASCPASDMLIILFKVDRDPSILSNLCRALSSFLPLVMCPDRFFFWKHGDEGRHWSIDIIPSGFIQHSNKNETSQ